MKAEAKIEVSQENTSSSSSGVLKFIIPSLIGVLLFLFPIKFNGEITIGVGVLSTLLKSLFNDYIPAFIVVILGISAGASIFTSIVKPRFILESKFLKGLFSVGIWGIVARLAGFLAGVMTIFEVGPEVIWSPNTGGVVLYDLAPILLTWFLFAGILLPLLVEFGLMEFIGALVQGMMRPLFRLPGRSSIDCLASWMGAGTVGVLITTKQYDQGYYTKREAAVIVSTFSITSIAFSLVVANVVGIGHLFVPFYLTVSVACMIAAVILPRIPPLSKKPDTYYEPVGQKVDETAPEGVSKFRWGWEQAIVKAQGAPTTRKLLSNGVHSVLDIWFGLIPLVMSLGVAALIIAEYTPFFQFISYPFIPILEWMQLPDAEAASKTMLVGFADMFLPAVIGSGIETEITRFVVAALSLTQLIYMSEIGILILRSNIPLTILELFIIFIQRTIITLPIIVMIAHIFIF